IRRTDLTGERGQLDRGDQLTTLQRRVPLGVLPGQAVQLGVRESPLAVRAGGDDGGVEDGEGDGEVGRVHRDALRRRPKDGVVMAVALAGRAAAAGLTLVARRRDVL